MGLYSWSIKVSCILKLEFQYHYFFENTNIYELKFTTRCASPVNTPSSVLQQDLHPPSSQVPHVQVQRARDAERDGRDEGAEDKPPQGLLQLQEGRGRRSTTPPLLLVLFAKAVSGCGEEQECWDSEKQTLNISSRVSRFF